MNKMPYQVPQNALMTMARSFDPAGFLYDFKRPKLQNADGTFSTEETITIGLGDRYYNIPTIWDGRRLDADSAIQRAIEALKRGAMFPNFASVPEAEREAALRSDWRGILERLPR